MTTAIESPPQGFTIGTTAAGESQILYRTTGMSVLICVFVGILAMLTTFCLFGTIATLFGTKTHDGRVVDFPALLMLATFWFLDFVALRYMVWWWKGVTVFTFRDDELLAESVLWRRVRGRTFKRAEIQCVMRVLISDGDSGGDPKWDVAIVGMKEVRVLVWQPERQAAWLAARIALWADVPINPPHNGKQKPIEWL